MKIGIGMIIGFSIGVLLYTALESQIGRWILLGIALLPVAFVILATLWGVIRGVWERVAWEWVDVGNDTKAGNPKRWNIFGW